MRYVGKPVLLTPGDFASFGMYSHIRVGERTMCGKRIPKSARYFKSARFVCPQCLGVSQKRQ